MSNHRMKAIKSYSEEEEGEEIRGRKEIKESGMCVCVYEREEQG